MSTIEISSFSSRWFLPVIYGIIAILLGCFVLFAPLDTAVTLAWAAGILALGEGIVSLTTAFSRNIKMSRNLLFFYAICSIFLGIIAILNPAAVIDTLLLFFAAWLIISGSYRIIYAILSKKASHHIWPAIISSLIAIAAGIMLALQPVTGIIIATIWIGLTAIIYGILQILSGLQLRKA